MQRKTLEKQTHMEKGHTYIVHAAYLTFKGRVISLKDEVVVFDQVRSLPHWAIAEPERCFSDEQVSDLVLFKAHIIAYRPEKG